MRRVLPYLFITLGFLVAAFVVSAAVSWGIRTTSPTQSAATRAWFEVPGEVNAGVKPGTVVHVTMRFGIQRELRWKVSNGGRNLSRGSVTNTPSGITSVAISTAGAHHRSWLLIRISGITTPLSAWVT